MKLSLPSEPRLNARDVPLPNSEKVVQDRRHEDVKHDIGPDYPEIPPALGPFNLAPCKVLVRNSQGAELALGGSIGILELATGEFHVFCHVLVACLVCRGVEDREFCG